MSVCVLIVEDDPLVRETAVLMFENLGARALAAGTGAEALRVLSSHPEVELLFTDVKMPGMDGATLARNARSVRPGLRVVLTTGYSDVEDKTDFVCVPKPYREADLRRIL
jgi:CheY-like chemotaxis protein